MRALLFIIFMLSCLEAEFIDNDFDGVDDNIDRCLNTPFKYTVNKDGCPQDTQYFGELNIELISTKQLTQNGNRSKTLYLDYYYNNYILSSSYSKYSTDDDLKYFAVGYKIETKKYKLEFYLGKSSFNKKGTINYDIKSGNIVYNLSSTYTFDDIADFINYSAGFTYKDFQISYLNSGSVDSFTNQYKNIDSSYSYYFKKYEKLYIKVGYNQSIDSNDMQIIYIGVGYSFE